MKTSVVVFVVFASVICVRADDAECSLCTIIQGYVQQLRGFSMDDTRQKLQTMFKLFNPDDLSFLTNITHYNIRKLYLDAKNPSPGMTPTTTCADMGYCDDEFMFKPTTFTPISLMPNWDDNTQLRDVRDRTIIVLHDTETSSLKETLDTLRDRGLSVTYVVDNDGKIYQLASEYRRTWHAGTGIWRGDGCLSKDTNGRSIGIETVNNGESPFAVEQVNSIHNLISYLQMKWHIAPQNIIAHHENGPNYKYDISGYFSWKNLYDKMNLWDKSLWETKLTPDQQKEVVLSATLQNTRLLENVQQMLYDYGYGTIVVGSSFTKSTTSVTTAMAVQSFNRKYVPELFIKERMVNGDQVIVPANQQVYRLTLERLTYLSQNAQKLECTAYEYDITSPIC